jgi:hypothetical protein
VADRVGRTWCWFAHASDLAPRDSSSATTDLLSGVSRCLPNATLPLAHGTTSDALSRGGAMTDAEGTNAIQTLCRGIGWANSPTVMMSHRPPHWGLLR